jgi:hypothetical protein
LEKWEAATVVVVVVVVMRTCGSIHKRVCKGSVYHKYLVLCGQRSVYCNETQLSKLNRTILMSAVHDLSQTPPKECASYQCLFLLHTSLCIHIIIKILIISIIIIVRMAMTPCFLCGSCRFLCGPPYTIYRVQTEQATCNRVIVVRRSSAGNDVSNRNLHVGSRCLTTTSEDWEEFMTDVVTVYEVCRSLRLIQLLVTGCKRSINPILSAIPICSHQRVALLCNGE